MGNPFLTTEEFSRWARDNDRKLDLVLGVVEATRDKVDMHGEAIAVLEDRSDRAERQARGAKGWSSAVAAVVSAVMTAAYNTMTKGH